MKHGTEQNGGKFEGIGGEAIYLRINQLQKGSSNSPIQPKRNRHEYKG
jgi:hypothetical protein